MIYQRMAPEEFFRRKNLRESKQKDVIKNIIYSNTELTSGSVLDSIVDEIFREVK
jgi:hypothetical protein